MIGGRKHEECGLAIHTGDGKTKGIVAFDPWLWMQYQAAMRYLGYIIADAYLPTTPSPG